LQAPPREILRRNLQNFIWSSGLDLQRIGGGKWAERAPAGECGCETALTVGSAESNSAATSVLGSIELAAPSLPVIVISPSWG
jgi:hypothetical protein